VLNELVENTDMIRYQAGFISNAGGTQAHISAVSALILEGEEAISIDCATAYNSIRWSIISEM